MTDGNTPCVRPTENPPQFDSPLHSSPADALLLAAQDADAAEALAKALAAAGIAAEPIGPALALRECGQARTEAHALLKRALPNGLQARVRAVFADAGCAPDSLLQAFIQAEPLSTLLDQMEVDWARQALEQRLLFSVYHPILDAKTRRLFAHEALMRATHPTTGETVGAASLIYACERLNLEHALDQQARIAAFEGARASGIDRRDGHLFVNLRPSAIYDPEVCLRTTLETAGRSGISLDRVVFEVIGTERVASLTRLRALVEYVRAQGAGIALDDISSGFTSLEHVAELRPDYAKVDRLLVESAVWSVASRHTLDSIVGLAGRLGVRVIAEGVETVEQMQVCIESGVNYLQGYLFAHPAAPPAAVPELAARAA